MNIRFAGRIIPMTLQGEVLLIKGHDKDNVDYSWWFTIGGGQKPNESIQECAAREFYEETNIQIDSNLLNDPFIIREGEFNFTNHTMRQKEHVFLVLFSEKILPDTVNFTSNEKSVIDEISWWNIDTLVKTIENTDTNLYPIGLEKILQKTYKQFKENNETYMETTYSAKNKGITSWYVNDVTKEIKENGEIFLNKIIKND